MFTKHVNNAESNLMYSIHQRNLAFLTSFLTAIDLYALQL